MIGKAGNFVLIPYKQRQARTPETADRSLPIRGNQTNDPVSLFPLFLLLLDLCKHRVRLVLRPSCRSQVEQRRGRDGDGRRAGDGGRNKRISIATAKQTDTNKSHRDPGYHLPAVHSGFSSALFACRNNASRGYHGQETNNGNKRKSHGQSVSETRPKTPQHGPGPGTRQGERR